MLDRVQGVPTTAAIKDPCRVASWTNIALYGLQTIDDIALVEDDRVLVTGQSDVTQCGIWVVHASDWQRSTDFDGNREVMQGTIIVVYGGTRQSGWYEVTTANPIVIGTSNIEFRRWLPPVGGGTDWDDGRTIWD